MKRLRITIEGKSYEVEVEMLDDEGQPMEFGTAPRRAAPRRAAAAAVAAVPAASTPAKASAAGGGGAGIVLSPLSAMVVSVDVQVGQAVNAGDRLITLEAMKMNTMVNATTTGTVRAIHVEVGNAVEEGQSLITIE